MTLEKPGVEMEVKFFLSDLPALRDRLLSLGAEQKQARTFEKNERFDTPDGALALSGRALRLRHDLRDILTFKGPSSIVDGVRVRPEHEVFIDNPDKARLILEGLGYEMTVRYEKWRTVYLLNDLFITLDELPYGHFIEIEGADTALIRATAGALALDWDARIEASYLELFERLKQSKGLTMRNLTFADFAGITLAGSDLGVRPADCPFLS